MRILLVNQFFWPDAAATSQLLTDLARALAAQGHEVEALCATSGYADGDRTDPPPVRVHRAPALRFARGKLSRVLSYASFLGSAVRHGLFARRPDVVLTLTTPPLVSLVGTLLKSWRGSRHYIWEMDVYPDVAVDLGYLGARSPLTRLIGAVADTSRRRADGILVLGECMRQRLLRRGIPDGLLHVAENWADSRLIAPQPRGDGEGLTLLYSGNLGLAHDVDTVRTAMLALREDERFRFVFVGGGAKRRELEQFCAAHSLERAEFRPYRSRDQLGEGLGEGDIGLVTQSDACLGSVVPSKVYGLMAAARPILFIGPREATPSRLIERFGCGWRVACGDHERLTALLRELAGDPQAVWEAGQRGLQAFRSHYDLPHGVARICGVLGATPVPHAAPALDLVAP